MPQEASPSFFQQMGLEMTREDKLAFLEAETKKHRIAVPDQIDRLAELVREQETKRMQECESYLP